MKLKRIVAGVQYDGAHWQGWQTQPHGLTVQDRLESAIAKFTQHSIATICAGRTDAGVHALEQVVHFDTDLNRPAFSWVRGLNAFLPSTIAIRWAHTIETPSDLMETQGEQADEFHARFSASSRTYHYLLYNHPVRSPLLVGRAGWVFRPLNVDSMRAAATHLIGTHDFSSFRSSECQARSPVRTMTAIDMQRSGNLIVVTLTANAFLQHMVRNIVGALIHAGQGIRSPEWVADILAIRDRSRAPPTFMADGLYLAKVAYDPKWKLPQEKEGYSLSELLSLR